MLPLTHGQHSKLAVLSKMLLAVLDPLLDCEQLGALKLTMNEANTYVSLLSEAVAAPANNFQGSTLLTYLKVMVSFSQEYHRQDGKLLLRNCSEYEKKLVLVSDELKANAELLVKGGILPVLSGILKLHDKIEVRVLAMRLLWCLTHNPTVKIQIPENDDILQALRSFNISQSPKLHMAAHCTLFLIDHQTPGMFWC